VIVDDSIKSQILRRTVGRFKEILTGNLWIILLAHEIIRKLNLMLTYQFVITIDI